LTWQSKKRELTVIIAIILVLAIALSSFVYLNSQKPYSGEIQPITVGFFNSEFNALVYIANDRGYFSNNGLNIAVKNYGTGTAAIVGLQNGEVEITGASEFVIASKALENANICTFGAYGKSDKNFIVARTDRGISSIPDLKGKTIGVPLGTNGEFYLRRFLELNNIAQNEVTFINMVPFVQTPNALANGTVDAAVAFQPYINEIESLVDDKTVMWPIQAGQLAYIDAISTRDWAQENPELIERFLRSLVQAEDFGLRHPDDAMAIVAKTLNLSIEYLQTVWSDYQFSVTLDQSQVLAMQDEVQWLINNHLTNASISPNILDFICVDGLKSVKPQSVNIIG
jgi:ABC-type nitrate/sulfonate/bicarbonate transport system substrate-binding protein